MNTNYFNLILLLTMGCSAIAMEPERKDLKRKRSDSMELDDTDETTNNNAHTTITSKKQNQGQDLSQYATILEHPKISELVQQVKNYQTIEKNLESAISEAQLIVERINQLPLTQPELSEVEKIEYLKKCNELRKDAINKYDIAEKKHSALQQDLMSCVLPMITLYQEITQPKQTTFYKMLTAQEIIDFLQKLNLI